MLLAEQCSPILQDAQSELISCLRGMIGKIVPIQGAAFGDAIRFTWLGQE